MTMNNDSFSSNPMSKAELIAAIEAADALEKKQKYNKVAKFFPDTGKYARSKYPKQMELMRAGKHHKLRALIGGNGCLPLNTTPVCMADGTKKLLKDVKEGDLVLCYDIKSKKAVPSTVLNFYNNGMNQVYRVWFSDGNYVDATDNHTFPRQRRSGRYIDCHGKKKEQVILKKRTDELKVKQRLLSPAVIEYQNNSSLPLHPYVLGCLLGDGSLGHASKQFTNADLGVIERFNSHWPLKKQNTNPYGYLVVQERSKNLHGKSDLNVILGDLGLEVNGKYKFIPSAYLTSSVENRKQLLAGLIDTDGSFGDFTNKSEQLVKDFCQLVRSLGGKANYKEVQKKCTNNGKISTYYRSYWRLNTDLPLSLDYKQKHTKRPVDYTQRIITKIEPIGQDLVGCIEVAHPDHCFLVHDFVAVGNSGKSLWMAIESYFHFSGKYPTWWEGHRFTKPIKAWLCGLDAKALRAGLQVILFGGIGDDEIGSGIIPRADLLDDAGHLMKSSMSGTADCIGQFQVRHYTDGMFDGYSTIEFMTYEQGWKSFQGPTKQWIGFDEEPEDGKIFGECVARLRGEDGEESGHFLATFTPTGGFRQVYLAFVPGGIFPADGTHIDDPSKYTCRIGWSNAPHLSEDWKKSAIAQWKITDPNNIEARTEGYAAMGSGRVYPIDESFVVVPKQQIPSYWRKAYGLDPGASNTAAVWVAQDPDTNVMYVYDEYKHGRVLYLLHGEAIKTRGAWIEGAIDPHEAVKPRDTGETVQTYFQTIGLNLTAAKGDPDALRAKIRALFDSGALKIMDNCQGLISEIRTYRYDINDPNKIAKNQEDHRCDALLYCLAVFDYIAKSHSEVEEEKYAERENRYKDDDGDSSRSSITGY